MNPIEFYRSKDRNFSDDLLWQLVEGDNTLDYNLVEELDVVDQGKYQYGGSIIEHKGKYYLYAWNRSGSYYSDYYYQDSEPYEVEKVKKITHDWVGKKAKKVD